jgi:hypothetical protein
MKKTDYFGLALAAGLVLAAGAAAPAFADAGGCVGAGVITRIDGDPNGVDIMRAGAKVTRPRVLEVVCVGDQVSATGGAKITLSIDGRGNVYVGPTPAPYLVAARAGSASLAGNAYRAVSDAVMPDMKRLPWDVRLKGGAGDFAFALPELVQGGQQMSPGSRALLLRVTGGAGPYSAVLTGPDGSVVGQATGNGADLLFQTAAFTPGRYHVSATDSTGVSIAADFTVEAKPVLLPTTYDAITDSEVRAAAAACELARAQSATAALEAEEVLASAPTNGLDRGRVYDLIESYGSD